MLYEKTQMKHLQTQIMYCVISFCVFCLVGMFSSIYVKADVLEPELIYNEYAEYATPEFLHNYTIHASGLKMMI